MYELFERTPSQKQMVILGDADHRHFGDDIEMPGDCSRQSAHAFAQALSLAHMDSVLKSNAAGTAFLGRGLSKKLSERGVRAAVHKA
jgi:hypothetical protein